MSRKRPSAPLVRFLICCFVPLFMLSCTLAAAEDKTVPSAASAGAGTGSLSNTEPGADVVCQYDVYFTWQKRPKEKKDEKGRVVVEQPPPPAEAFFSTISVSGINEPDVRSNLTNLLPQAKAQALEHCRNAYEDLGGCISNHLKSRATEYSSMDFPARKSLLSAIENDCNYTLGTCLSSDSKDVRCFLNKPLETKPAAVAAEAGGQKESKDKKKK
jgi:hypothetical protein